MHDTAIFIGRFQPLHSGHLALIEHALAHARQAIVVLGSAWQARSCKNPFSWQERAEMIRQALPEADRARLQFLPVRDYYNETRWVAAVRDGVQALVAQSAYPSQDVALVGHVKDASSAYLNHFPGWQLLTVDRQGAGEGTLVRNAYFGCDKPKDLPAALASLADQLPPSTLNFLLQWASTPEYARLQIEWRQLQAHQKAWSVAPYSPTFVTVDAVLRCQGHVLLIRRGSAPGAGLWAVPGGFLEPADSLLQSCLRELAEETHFPLSEAALLAALKAVAVFDHPGRSQRGRTITHAHFFDLGDIALPDVQGGDDAALAEWLPIAGLVDHEAEFFEDHFHMLDHFLGITAVAT